jgi:hypothetical protein
MDRYLFPRISLERPLIAADEFRSKETIFPRVFALITIIGEDIRCLQHIVGLLKVMKLSEVELLGFLGWSVRVFALISRLGLLIVEDLNEEGDWDAFKLGTLSLLIDTVFL